MSFLTRLFGKGKSTSNDHNSKLEEGLARKSEVSRYETILTKTDKLLLCAFLIEANPDASMGVFQKTVLIQASENELKEKIRAQCQSSNADVLIIPPSDWSPPPLRSVSQQELTQHFPEVLSSAAAFLESNGRTDLNIQMLTKTGTVLPNPVSGKVFFIFKIEPVVPVTESSIKQAFLLHDKGREQMNAGQLKDAYASFAKAVSISDSIISVNSKNPDAFFVKALSSGLMGNIQMKLDGSADKFLRTMSIEAFKNMLAVAPSDYDSDRIRIAKTMVAK
jgi:hypothetical protein